MQDPMTFQRHAMVDLIAGGGGKKKNRGRRERFAKGTRKNEGKREIWGILVTMEEGGLRVILVPTKQLRSTEQARMARFQGLIRPFWVQKSIDQVQNLGYGLDSHS